MLHPQLFSQIEERIGHLEVDMFASRLTSTLFQLEACLSELEGGDETVEPPELPVLLLLSYPQRLLASVLILLTWHVIAWPPVESGLFPPWAVTLAL